MIKYSLNIKDIKRIKRDVITYHTAPLIAIGILAFISSIFFLFVGLIDDLQALNYFYPSLAVLLIVSFFIILLSIKCSKQLNGLWEKIYINGILEYTFEKVGDDIKTVCLTDNRSYSFKSSEISIVYNKKHAIIVRLKSRATYVFPNDPEIKKLLDE